MGIGLDTLQEWRDVFLIAFTALGTLLFFVAMLFTLFIGWQTVSTLRKVRKVLDEDVRPTLDNVREATENAKGTVGFMSDKAVKPVMRAYGFYSGARKFAAVVGRVSKKKKAR